MMQEAFNLLLTTCGLHVYIILIIFGNSMLQAANWKIINALTSLMHKLCALYYHWLHFFFFLTKLHYSSTALAATEKKSIEHYLKRHEHPFCSRYTILCCRIKSRYWNDTAQQWKVHFQSFPALGNWVHDLCVAAGKIDAGQQTTLAQRKKNSIEHSTHKRWTNIQEIDLSF